MKTESRGKTIDPHTHRTIRRDRRTGTAVRTRLRELREPHYKGPQLHEQEYRTRLATLRVGERLVRDRAGVRRERVKPLRPPRVREGFDAFTRAVIDRVRSSPLYLPPSSPRPPADDALPDAAARLRRMADPAGSPTALGTDAPVADEERAAGQDAHCPAGTPGE